MGSGGGQSREGGGGGAAGVASHAQAGQAGHRRARIESQCSRGGQAPRLRLIVNLRPVRSCALTLTPLGRCRGGDDEQVR